jgi:hypothetical protein
VVAPNFIPHFWQAHLLDDIDSAIQSVFVDNTLLLVAKHNSANAHYQFLALIEQYFIGWQILQRVAVVNL